MYQVGAGIHSLGKKALFIGKSVSLSSFIPRIVKILTRAHTPASSE